MQNFKFLSLSPLIVCLFFGACWSPLPDESHNPDIADFNIGGVTITHRTESSEMNQGKSWKFDDKIIYTIKACLVNSINDQKIREGHHFEIISPNIHIDKEVKDSTVRSDGCLQWNETITYNFLNTEQFLLLNPSIRAKQRGPYRGTREVRIVINPWADLSGAIPSFYWPLGAEPDVEESKILKAPVLVRQALSDFGPSHPLWINVTSFSLLKSSQRFETEEYIDPITGETKTAPYGIGVAINIEMEASLAKPDRDHQIHQIKIRDGKYKVFAHLVGTELGVNNNESLRLTTANHPPIVCNSDIQSDKNGNGEVPPHGSCTVQSVNGKIRLTMHSALTSRLVKGRLVLVLRVVPLEAPQSITHFDGKYVLGNYSQLAGHKKPLLLTSDRERFDFDKFLKSTSNFEDLKKAREVYSASPYIFGISDVKFERVLPGETSTRRTIQFRVRTCLTNTLEGNRAAFRKFYVRRNNVLLENKDENENPIPYFITDVEGCLNLPGTVTHGFYLKEQLIHSLFDIREFTNNPGESSSEFKKEIQIFVNPWDPTWTFGRDNRILTYEYRKSIKETDKIPSRFFIPNFSYNTRNFRYDIDEFLNLTVKKTVILPPRTLSSPLQWDRSWTPDKRTSQRWPLPYENGPTKRLS